MEFLVNDLTLEKKFRLIVCWYLLLDDDRILLAWQESASFLFLVAVSADEERLIDEIPQLFEVWQRVALIPSEVSGRLFAEPDGKGMPEVQTGWQRCVDILGVYIRG